jgi:hypothetical protein
VALEKRRSFGNSSERCKCQFLAFLKLLCYRFCPTRKFPPIFFFLAVPQKLAFSLLHSLAGFGTVRRVYRMDSGLRNESVTTVQSLQREKNQLSKDSV